MEKRIINPWNWSSAMGYVQAVEVTAAEGVLYVSGQTAIDANGKSSNEDMSTQLKKSIENLERVITEAGYDCENIVRLNIYTTSAEDLLPCFNLLQEWVGMHNMKQATTLLEVNSLFETLTIELEATVVR